MVFLVPFLFVGFVMVLALIPLVFAVLSIVEVSRAPIEAFGPPWDNGRNPWLIGLVVALVLPLGAIVGSVLWWTQGRPALRAGRPVPPPFWAPRRTYPPAPPPG